MVHVDDSKALTKLLANNKRMAIAAISNGLPQSNHRSYLCRHAIQPKCIKCRPCHSVLDLTPLAPFSLNSRALAVDINIMAQLCSVRG